MIFTGVDPSDFQSHVPALQLRAVSRGVEHVLSQADGKERLFFMVSSLSRAFALVAPRPESEAVRDDLGYFQAVAAAIRKHLSDESSPPPDTRAAVRQIVSGAPTSEGVIDLFDAAGFPSSVEVLSDDFLQLVGEMPQQNLALETLRKLLSDEIHDRARVNIVQARSFREALSDVLLRYNNRAIGTAQVIDELISLARLIRDAVRSGTASGLSSDELAFYDALADNASAREVLRDENLRAIARELAERIRSKATSDWTER